MAVTMYTWNGTGWHPRPLYVNNSGFTRRPVYARIGGSYVLARMPGDGNTDGGSLATYTDNFSGYTSADLAGQGNWIYCLGLIEAWDPLDLVYSNTAGDAIVIYNSAFNNNQWCKLKVYSTATADNEWMGPAVRCSGTNGTSKCYGYISTYTYSTFVRVVNGVSTEIGSQGSPWSVNDIVEIRVSGTTLSAYKNGTLDTTVGTGGTGQITDANISSGKAGIFGAGNASMIGLILWSSGDL